MNFLHYKIIGAPKKFKHQPRPLVRSSSLKFGLNFLNLSHETVPLTVKTFHICGEADCTASGHSKSRREHKDFWAGSERYTLRAISEANINFFACFFLKHKLHLILPMTMQKQTENG
jgi:hypothetical protein